MEELKFLNSSKALIKIKDPNTLIFFIRQVRSTTRYRQMVDNKIGIEGADKMGRSISFWVNYIGMHIKSAPRHFCRAYIVEFVKNLHKFIIRRITKEDNYGFFFGRKVGSLYQTVNPDIFTIAFCMRVPSTTFFLIERYVSEWKMFSWAAQFLWWVELIIIQN